MHNEAKPETEEIYTAVATGYAIYGLGKDEAEAITDAKKWVEREYEEFREYYSSGQTTVQRFYNN